MTGLVAMFHFIDRDIVCMMIDGERAAVHSRVKIRYVPRDMTVSTDLLDTFHFNDRKIVEFVEFADTALVKGSMSAG
jgi:predicted SnoaL-like aldol condensation-catalyzing enzyme